MRTVSNAQRGCGHMKEGAYYLQGMPASEDGVLPCFVELRHYIPTLEDHFRGYEYINGFAFEYIHEPEYVFPEGYEETLIVNLNKTMRDMDDGKGIPWDSDTIEKYAECETEFDRHLIRVALDRVPMEVDTMNFQGKRAMPELHAFDILMYVGESYYETPQHFIDEAFALGFSKRISSPPEAVWLGRTKVWFAHRKAIWDEEARVWVAGVFGYAYLSHTIWTKPKHSKTIPEKVGDLELLGRVEIVQLGDEEGSVREEDALETFGDYPEEKE